MSRPTPLSPAMAGAIAVLAAGCTSANEGPPQPSQPVYSPGGAVEDVFFPTWKRAGPGGGLPQAGVSGVLTERDRCLFLSNGGDVLPLWESGYSYADGALLDSSGQVVVRAGEMLYGGGGYYSEWQAAEALVGQPIPKRCRPDGAEPSALIFDVGPDPPA